MQNTAHGGVAPRHHHVSWEHALHDELWVGGKCRRVSGIMGWTMDKGVSTNQLDGSPRSEMHFAFCSTQSRGQSGMLGLHTRMYLGGELAK